MKVTVYYEEMWDADCGTTIEKESFEINSIKECNALFKHANNHKKELQKFAKQHPESHYCNHCSFSVDGELGIFYYKKYFIEYAKKHLQK